MFEKTLTDLVKGIRSHKNDEESFIRNCIAEIRSEVKSNDMKKKANAVQKLTYLHMMGYDMHWAAIHAIECMSQPHFHYKRIGYLAASLLFTQQTEEVILTTQLFRKDLNNREQYDVGLALSTLANVATPELARDLVSDVVALLNSQRPYIRKKAALILYKLFLRYPDALKPTFPQLKERLADNHPAVVACAVNVICELARRNPQNYLPMAPVFYKLLTSLNNNWTLIKIVKLFGALAPLEPRLAKKLVDPIANIINTTQAKSLQYECLHTATVGMKGRKSVIGLVVEKLKQFIENPDQNLKYLGLVGLNNLLDKHPLVIADLKDTILECLEDSDITIRHRAVDLLCGVISKKNAKNIIHRLMRQLKNSESSEYRNYLVEKIISACTNNNYECISNFKWYLEKLIEMTEFKGTSHGKLIASQIMDIVIRVKSIRGFGVSEMAKMLNSSMAINESSSTSNMFEVLHAAAYIVGEFIRESDEDLESVLNSLLNDTATALPSRIQSMYVQSIMKVYAASQSKRIKLVASDDDEHQSEDDHIAVEANGETEEDVMQKQTRLRNTIRTGVTKLFGQSNDVELQERVYTLLKALQLHEESLASGTDIINELASLFDEELVPVAPDAQERVPIPEGLNLDKWIGAPFTAAKLEEFDEDYKPPKEEEESEEDEDEEEFRGKKTAPTVDRSMFYLKDKNKNDPNIKTQDLSALLGKEAVKPKKKKSDKKKKRSEKEEEHAVTFAGYEAPEGIVDLKKAKTAEKKTFDPLNIDLSQPSDDVLYKPAAYPTAAETLKKAEDELDRQKQAKKLKAKKKSSATEDADADTTSAKKKGTKKKKSAESDTATEKKTKKKSTKKAAEAGEENGSKKTGSDKSGESSTVAKAAPPKKPKKGPRKRLCRDEHLKVTYNNNVMPSDANHITIPFIFENDASSGVLENFSMRFDTHEGIEPVRSEEPEAAEKTADEPIRATFGSITPGNFDTLSVQFKFDSVVETLQLSGNIEYTLDAGEPQTLPFSMQLPCYMFVQPKEMSVEELGDMIREGKLPHQASTRITLATEGVADVDAAATRVATTLRLAVLDFIEGDVYTMFGQSVQEHDIAALIKCVDHGVAIDVQIRCSDDALGNSLLSEVTKLFVKPAAGASSD